MLIHRQLCNSVDKGTSKEKDNRSRIRNVIEWQGSKAIIETVVFATLISRSVVQQVQVRTLLV